MDRKVYYASFLMLVGIFVIDQNIKSFFLSGYLNYGECISLVFALNKGVAFSMFEFLGEWLKWLQLAILAIISWNIVKMGQKFLLPLAMVVGAGLSNIYDRFIHGGVVDYVYWHCGFEFAIFNFADVMIDIGVVLLLILSFRKDKANNN